MKQLTKLSIWSGRKRIIRKGLFTDKKDIKKMDVQYEITRDYARLSWNLAI